MKKEAFSSMRNISILPCSQRESRSGIGDMPLPASLPSRIRVDCVFALPLFLWTLIWSWAANNNGELLFLFKNVTCTYKEESNRKTSCQLIWLMFRRSVPMNAFPKSKSWLANTTHCQGLGPLAFTSPQWLQESIVIDRWSWLWENPSKPSHRGKELKPTRKAHVTGHHALHDVPLTTHLQELPSGLAIAMHAVFKSLLQGGTFYLDQVKCPSKGQYGSQVLPGDCALGSYKGIRKEKELKKLFPQRPPPLSWANKGRGCHSHCV